MSTVNEKSKRDLITQLIVLIEQNTWLLAEQGFDLAPKIAALKLLKTEAEADEESNGCHS